MENSDPAIRLIQIHASDNIAVLPRSVTGGTSLHFEDQVFQTTEAVGLGHKFAVTEIKKSEKVIKYGVPIGSASRDIRPGEHVHTHNLQSDYLPTFTLDEGRKFTR